MSARRLLVVRPGLMTTVQDLGRWGHQALGVPVAGAMDTASARLANVWVGNPETAAVLEVSVLGPRLRADGPSVVAVAGATFDLRVNDQPVASHAAIALAHGDELAFGARRVGARAYVAVAGGIDTPLVLGSRATHMVSRMGGLDGRALVAGDVLPLGELAASTGRPRVGPMPALDAGESPVLRVLLGPQDDWFTAAAIEALVGATFTVSPQSDRMGFRLSGPALPRRHPGELISEPTPIGALQVPADGAPILLMADRQTAGGYPKIATVITADLPAAAQLAPGDRVRFSAATRHEARAALVAREQAFHALVSDGGTAS